MSGQTRSSLTLKADKNRSEKNWRLACVDFDLNSYDCDKKVCFALRLSG